MKSPIQLLIHRRDEMNTEYARVLNLNSCGSVVTRREFEVSRTADLYEITANVTEYEKAIRLLTELKEQK